MTITTQPPPWATGVTVLVPVYNEAAGVGSTLRQLSATMRQLGCPYELLVINDGSTDASNEAIGTHDEPALRLIVHRRNQGYGASLTEGLHAARFPLLVICDADGSYPVNRIPVLLAQLERHVMAIGARPGAGGTAGTCRWLAKWCLRRLAEAATKHPIPDLNSGLRAMRREMVLPLTPILPRRFSWTSTITVALLRQGAAVTFVPISYHRRVGVSKFRPVRDTLRSLHCIARAVSFTSTSPKSQANIGKRLRSFLAHLLSDVR